MSPGGTMMRVYAALKRRILDGGFAPGTRLDPTRLKDELISSTTPIRDALHRLTGEGLIESWQHEGFRITQTSEPALRDLYDWSRELAHIALRAAAQHSVSDRRPTLRDAGYPEAVTALLLDLAALSPNHELRRAMASLCDRGYHLRAMEEALLDNAKSELRLIGGAIADGNWDDAVRAIDRFHARLIDLVPRIAAGLRDRAQSDRL